jgi:thioester reductase-like protein
LHCAAITDHVGYADIFYNTNVLGTKNAADIAKRLSAVLLHVSTYSVSGTYYIIDKNKTGEFSEDCFYVGQNYTDNEYIKSKYLAEEFVFERINEGLNARIFRVGLLTGTMDGRFQMRPEKNAFANQLKGLCSVGCVPLKMLGTKLEMTPVDSCAQAILALAGAEVKTPVFHVFNDNTMTVADIVSLLEQNGHIMEVITNEEFLNRMKTLSKKGSLSQLAGLIDDLNTQEAVRITVTCDKTKELLYRAGFSWPVIDAEYMGRFISTINRRDIKEI